MRQGLALRIEKGLTLAYVFHRFFALKNKGLYVIATKCGRIRGSETSPPMAYLESSIANVKKDAKDLYFSTKSVTNA